MTQQSYWRFRIQRPITLYRVLWRRRLPLLTLTTTPTLIPTLTPTRTLTLTLTLTVTLTLSLIQPPPLLSVLSRYLAFAGPTNGEIRIRNEEIGIRVRVRVGVGVGVRVRGLGMRK